MKILELIKNEKTEIAKSLLFSAFVVLIFIFGVGTAFIVINQQNSEDLNDFFYLNYQNFVQKEGALNIEQTVQEVDHIALPEEKLNTIANLIVTNFTDPFWPESSENLFNNKCFGSPIPFNHRFFGNNCNGYGFDKNGAIRIRTGNLTNNPYWIAYYKTGACGELATLFANVTNQSGFITRVVYSSDPDHAWTEVFLNDKWQYFDPDMYHNLQGNITYQKYWFDNTSSFEKKIGWKFSKISVSGSTSTGYEEDRTYAYTKTGKVKITIIKPVDRIVVRERDHASYVWTFVPSCSNYPCVIESNLGSGKTYVLQKYIPTLQIFIENSRFSVKENEIVNISVDTPIRFDSSSSRLSELSSMPLPFFLGNRIPLKIIDYRMLMFAHQHSF